MGFPLKNTAVLILLWGDFFSSTIICIFIIIFLWVKETFSAGDNSGLGFLFSSHENQEDGSLASHYRSKCEKKIVFSDGQNQGVKPGVMQSALVCTHLVCSAHHRG